MTPIPRPSADLLTGLGAMLMVGTACACAVIVTLHAPTVATFAGLFGSGAIGVWVRLVAPHPSSVPTPTHPIPAVSVVDPAPQGAPQEHHP